MEIRRRYPVGIQDFEQLRNRNCMYIDKTHLIYQLANSDSIHFLSRPRRFGKSLLVSTLEAYFQGKKELFEGLAMEQLEKDWRVYPVLHTDFSMTKYTQIQDIEEQLNNLQNISMNDRYSAICGITEQELLTHLQPDIETMAQANNETYEQACIHLKQTYDGYHFSKNSEDIYNPFSIINALNTRNYDNFWFATGTPTFLIELLQRVDFDLTNLDGITATAEQFDAPTDEVVDPIPVLYQSGYLTIKEYDPTFRLYLLGYPNKEVRQGFLESLLPAYVHRFARENTFYVVSFIKDLQAGDLEQCLLRTRAFFASIPYDLENNQEKHYQTIFYLLFRLMGQYVDVEVKSAIGRADVVVKLPDAIYVFEFKVDGTPEEALAQIESKQYAIPYVAEDRKTVKVGVNFDSTTRTIGEWKTQ